METILKESEIEWMEFFYDPIALSENLMPVNEHSPQAWNENCKTICLRDYQLAMLNYAPCYADDSKLKPEQNLAIKKGAGDLFTIGARNTGKSFLLKIDLLLSVVYNVVEICLASFDDYHLKKVATPIADYLESHEFFKIFHLKKSRKESVQRTPLNAKFEHGSIIESANEHVKGNNPGEQFHSKHYDALYYEEFSYTSEEGTKKRIDSGRSIGYIFRPSGIPDLDIGSPLGKILQDPNKRNWIWQLPQYVRDDYTDQTHQEKIDEYGGENTASFKLNVLAETVEGAFGFFDIERIRLNSVNESRRVKFFEIGKDTFEKFEELLIVERLSGAEQVFICADIGHGAAPTEIIIVFYANGKYKYIYNISLFRLIQEEQAQIFKWLYDKVGGAFVAIDATSDGGVVNDYLFTMGVPQEHLLKVKFNENIEIDFERDKDGEIIIDKDGDPVMKEANTEHFSFEELERLLYDGRSDIAWDDKFITQFTNILCKQIGLMKKFDSKGANHIVQSIPEDEVVLCKIKNKLISDKIANIYKKSKDVIVPTYDTGKVVWKKGTIIKELNKGNKIFDFKFKPSKSLKVTEGHSMLVWNRLTQKLENKLAKNIELGDLVLTAQNLRHKKQFAYLKLPIEYKFGRKKIKVKKKIVLDEDLAYFLGWCCAEGSCSGDGSYQLALANDDPYIKIKDLIYKLFDFYPRIYLKDKMANFALLGGKGISRFIVEQIGKHSKHKKIPDSILSSKQSVRDSFLKGLIEGDGNKYGRLTTTSRAVANGFLTCKSLNKKHTGLTFFKNKYGNYEYYLQEAVRDGYFANIPYKALQYNYKQYKDSKNNKTLSRKEIQQANYTWKSQLQSNKLILDKVKDFEFTEVTKINSYEYTGYIYDLSVKDTHNFLAGVGNIVVHNSFQVWAVCRFFNEFNILKNQQNNKTRCFGVFNTENN